MRITKLSDLSKLELVTIIQVIMESTFCGSYHGYGFSDEEMEKLSNIYVKANKEAINNCQLIIDFNKIEI